MNEFAAKKLGEVLAFCRVGQETFDKAREGFIRDIEKGEEIIDMTIAGLKERATKIEALVTTAGVSDITMAKADATGNKLRSMRDLYIGDEWDNPTEVLEWSGFFEGAALVHWALVIGAAESLKLTELQTLAEEGCTHHEDMVERVSYMLQVIGAKRAQS